MSRWTILAASLLVAAAAGPARADGSQPCAESMLVAIAYDAGARHEKHWTLKYDGERYPSRPFNGEALPIRTP